MMYYRGMIDYRFAKKLLLLCFLPIGFFALLSSCHDKDDHLDLDYKYGYFPLDSGRYITYQVDSFYSSDIGIKHDTAHYQLKVAVTDTFYDLLNDLNYELTLYRRADDVSPWTLDRVWYAHRYQYNAQVIEDDIRFIKLIFPPKTDATWEGNSYIPIDQEMYKDFRNWEYHYESVDVPLDINTFHFDSTLTAIDADYTDNVFGKLYRKEVYAKGVGLISQDWEIKNSNQPNAGGNWETGSWAGFSLHWRIIDHN